MVVVFNCDGTLQPRCYNHAAELLQSSNNAFPRHEENFRSQPKFEKPRAFPVKKSHRAKSGQAEQDDENGERQPDRAADANAIFRRRGKIQKVAQLPRRHREPDSGHDQNISPNLNHQNPGRFAQMRTARVHHQSAQQQKQNGQPAHRQKILHKNTRQQTDCRKGEHHFRFVSRKIRERFSVHVPQKPRRAQQHQKNSGGQIARKFADGCREFLRVRDSVNLRRGKTETEQNGQKRQFHFRNLTTNGHKRT